MLDTFVSLNGLAVVAPDSQTAETPVAPSASWHVRQKASRVWFWARHTAFPECQSATAVPTDALTASLSYVKYAEALSDGVIEGDDVARTGGIVAAEASRLDRLVTDLLDLARLGAVDFHVSPVEVDLVEIGEDASAVWSDRATREGVHLSLEFPDEAVVVKTDPIRVRQIIDNLAENALRVSPPDSLIVIAVRREGPNGVVEVRDSGPGLTADDVAVAFEPGVLHERYRGVRPVGTGLGLALVGRLAVGLGGSAEAGTAAEGGARFTVRIPG